MKSIIIKLTFVFCVLSFGACDNDADEIPDDSDRVQIRVRNVSEIDYSNVYVDSSGNENNYGAISAGQDSEYKSYDFAFRYGYVKLNAGGEQLVLQPYDYFGEEKLEPGKYTYEIGINALGNGLTLKLVID